MTNTWTALYCEGWDGPAGQPIGNLSRREALQRDADGLPYSVLIAEDDEPRFVLDIAWQQFHLARWTLDMWRRRTARAVFVLLEDGALFERKLTEWHYDVEEFDGDPAILRRTFDRNLNGRTSVYRKHKAGLLCTRKREAPDRFMHSPPRFGAWNRFLGIESAITDRHIDRVEVDPDADRPWEPPRPFQAPYLGKLLTEGATVAQKHFEQPRSVVHRAMGTLNLPTGSVVACDPFWIKGVAPFAPFTVSVAPGSYEAVEILIRSEPDGNEAGAGCLLKISDNPTVTWEMALRPGQDIRLLDDGHFYGYGVDTGMGCFLDDATQRAVIEHDQEDLHTWLATITSGQEFLIPDTDLNLFAYLCEDGDGSYPTWIGRDNAGEVTCYLSDMLVLDNGRPRTWRQTFEQDY